MHVDKEIREHRYTIRLTASEAGILETKMREAGVTHAAAFIRAMTLNGYLLQIDLPELREMIGLLSNMTRDLNQIARRLDTHGQIYDTEIEEMQQKQNDIWAMTRQLLSRLEATQ